MDLNLKGINLKLNEKLPFALPKDKKKKPTWSLYSFASFMKLGKI